MKALLLHRLIGDLTERGAMDEYGATIIGELLDRVRPIRPGEPYSLSFSVHDCMALPETITDDFIHRATLARLHDNDALTIQALREAFRIDDTVAFENREHYLNFHTKKELETIAKAANINLTPPDRHVKRNIIRAIPDFLPRKASHVHVCGFQQGKPHEPTQSQPAPQEIRDFAKGGIHKRSRPLSLP